jgi:mRNA interferase RelE/StbE
MAKLAVSDARRVDDKIMGLAGDPRPPGATKLEGVDNLHRIRSGDYRVLYQIDDESRVGVVGDVANRRDAYLRL